MKCTTLERKVPRIPPDLVRRTSKEIKEFSPIGHSKCRGLTIENRRLHEEWYWCIMDLKTSNKPSWILHDPQKWRADLDTVIPIRWESHANTYQHQIPPRAPIPSLPSSITIRPAYLASACHTGHLWDAKIQTFSFILGLLYSPSNLTEIVLF